MHAPEAWAKFITEFDISLAATWVCIWTASWSLQIYMVSSMYMVWQHENIIKES